MSRPEPGAALIWGGALILTLASGAVHGRLVGRWRPAPRLEAALKGLGRLPESVGAWSGQELDPDLATLRRSGLAGGRVRRYRDARTGSELTVLLVCGRPGPVSVHTPDVCYQGAGYDLAAPPVEAIPGFQAARRVRTGEAVSEALDVYWSWNAAGRWEAPRSPRIAFATRPALFKLYVIKSAMAVDEGLGAGPAAEFIRELIPALALSPDAGTPGS